VAAKRLIAWKFIVQASCNPLPSPHRVNATALDAALKRFPFVIAAARSIRREPGWDQRMIAILRPQIYCNIVMQYRNAIESARIEDDTRQLFLEELRGAA
jgi:hypothetical protein